MRRLRIFTWATALALSALLIADASACGRRSRGGGGSCGGGGAAFYGGGCAGSGYGYGGYAYGAGYSFNPPSAGWEWGAASAPAWNAPAWGAPGFQAPTLMPGAAFPTGGASAAIAADRARRGSAVYALDPATGVLRQVGWLNADGTLRALNESGTAPTPPPR